MNSILLNDCLSTLSVRESAVVRLATLGLKDSSICRRLQISQGTLGTHWSRVRRKTGLINRAQVAAACATRGCAGSVLSTAMLVAEKATEYESGAGEALAQDVFDALPVGALVALPDGTVVARNATSVRTFQAVVDLGSSLVDRIEKGDADAFASALRLAVSSSEGLRFRASMIVPSGEVRCRWLVKRLSTDSPLLLVLASSDEDWEH
ncbi:MAG: helix-turn-helix transcriptional regulator [Armatimonadetes bacterium]|nr:helix-turn-helix transcriptional regulator [Armatimonadota bacterium]